MAVIDEDVGRATRMHHNQAAIPTHVTPCGYVRVSPRYVIVEYHILIIVQHCVKVST